MIDKTVNKMDNNCVVPVYKLIKFVVSLRHRENIAGGTARNRLLRSLTVNDGITAGIAGMAGDVSCGRSSKTCRPKKRDWIGHGGSK